MTKKFSYEVKEMLVQLSGNCFWYWNSFHAFLHACGVPKELTQRFPKDAYNKYDVMRNVISWLEEKCDFDTMNTMVSEFYRLRNPVDKEKLDVNAAQKLLKDFRELVGNDPIEREIEIRNRQQAKESYSRSVDVVLGKNKRLKDLNNQFLKLALLKEMTPQQRGFKLESLIFDLFQLCEFECTRPYRTPGNEQIDGHFRFEKFDYLVESKWERNVSKQADLSVFDGKIRGKAQSTRGLFVSASGFDETAVIKYSGDEPRILLMTGEDLSIVLEGRMTFFDAMKAKVDSIVRHGKILQHLRDVN